MQNYATAPAPHGAKPATTEDAVEAIRATLGDTARAIMVVSGVVDGEVSGVVIGDTSDDDYISSQELAAGVVYIIVGLGKLPTVQPAGVVVMSLTQAESNDR